MSARRFKPSSPKKKRPSAQVSSSGLIPLSEAPRLRLPPNTTSFGIPRHNTVLVLPAKKRYTQINAPSTKRPLRPRSHDSDDPFSVGDNEQPSHIYHEFISEEDTNRNGNKRRRQWRQWQEETIPSLVAPYLALLRQTSSFCDPPPLSEPPECSCSSGRSLRVLCVYFERKYHFDMHIRYPDKLITRATTNRSEGLLLCSCCNTIAPAWPFPLRSLIPDTCSEHQPSHVRQETLSSITPQCYWVVRDSGGLLGCSRV